MRLYAENNTNYIKSLDTGSTIKLQVINNDNTPMDLTVFENIEVLIGDENNMILNIVPLSTNNQGFLEFNIPSNSLSSGKYYLEVNMTKSNKELYIAPSVGQFIVTVSKSLNEAGKEVSIINLKALLEKIEKAVDSSSKAIRTSETALEQSNLALSISNEAVEIANNTTETANEANTKSDEAIEIANKSIADSKTALSKSEIAETNSIDAKNKSNEALENSTAANEKSDSAINKSSTAEENSTIALNKSDEAIITANNANEKSDTAIAASNTANTNSDEALIKSKEALAFANSAETKSSESLANALNAVDTANNVRKDFDKIIKESGNVDAEVILSRTNVEGFEFESLKQRLDSMETDVDTKTQQAVAEHSNLKNNPHDVTAEQIGAYTRDEVDTRINTVITNLNWKDSVDTFDSIAIAYPDPQDGWTVNVNDTDMTYRYTDTEWIAISANSIPLATSENDGKMSKTDKSNLDEHLLNKDNPHNVTKEQINLGNVDNTSDLDKPISIAAQLALDLKADNTLVSSEDHGLMSVEDKVKLDRLASDEKGSLLKGYTYTIQATNNGQTDFQIPLDTFNPETDFVMISQNRTLLENDAFSIVQVASNYYIRLVESVVDYTLTSISIYILKNDASIAIVESIPIVSNKTNGLMTKEDKKKIDTLLEYVDSKSVQDLIDVHANKFDNPHNVTAEQVGLGNVDNTSDLEKPISSATQAELDSLNASDNKPVYGNEIHGLRINSKGNLEYLNTTNDTWIEIRSGSSEGEPLRNYNYKIPATVDGQTDFKMPLTTFDKNSDLLIVTLNGVVLENSDYSIAKAGENQFVRLAEGVEDYEDTSLSLIIQKGTVVVGEIADIPLASNTVNGLMSKKDKADFDNLLANGSGTDEVRVQELIDAHANNEDIHTTLVEKEALTKIVSDVGDKTLLLTESKSDVVSAVNEIHTNVDKVVISKYTKPTSGIPKSDLNADVFNGYLTKNKKSTTLIVGSSVYGHTADEVDFLCDGIADEDEINLAISSLPASGGEVVLLNGSYVIAKTITMNKASVSLKGVSLATKLLKDSTSLGDTDINYKRIVTITKGYCSVSNIHFMDSSTSYNFGIHAISAIRTSIFGNYFQSNGTGISISSCSFVTIANNNFDSESYGIETSWGKQMTISNNMFANCDDQAVNIRDSSNNCTITGNTITNGYIGIYINGCKDNTVIGNVCTSNTMGIKTVDSSKLSINGNTLSDNMLGIDAMGSSLLNISGNTIMRGTGTAGDYQESIYTNIQLDNRCNNNLICGNLVMGRAIINAGTNTILANNK